MLAPVLRSPLYLSAVPTCKESDVMMTPSEFGVATVLNNSSLYPTTPSLPPPDEYSVSSLSAVQDIFGCVMVLCVFVHPIDYVYCLGCCHLDCGLHFCMIL